MRVFVSIAFIIVFLAVGFQLYRVNAERVKFGHQAAATEKERADLERENEALRADIRYFGETRNLLKEFRSLFNYRAPGEKLIIVVPPEAEQ